MASRVQVTAVMSEGQPNARRMTRVKTEEMNNRYIFGGDANRRHKPEYYVGIFNVSDMEHKIERPWVHPQRLGKCIIIPACEPDQPFSSPFVIPDIVQMPEEHAGSWRFSTRGEDGRFLAQDAINPEDPFGSWKTARAVGAGVAANEGTNLYFLGCFWSTAPTREELAPTEEEVQKAHERLEWKYNNLIEEARLFATQGPDGMKLIGNLHRRAANYFNLDEIWNRRYTRKVACPLCGEPVNASAAVCPHCPGVLNWERAVRGGARSIEQAAAAGIIIGQIQAMADQEPPKPKKRAS